MSKKADLVRTLKERQRDLPDREVQKTEWLDAIEKLLAQIDGWMTDLKAQKLAQITRYKDHVVIDDLGEYRAPGLEIEMGGALVRVVPVARTIIGARGRVDLVRAPKKKILLLNAANAWEFAALASPKRIRLTQEGFFAALADLIE